MKKDTHPTYFKEAKIKCACGQEFKIPATKQEIHIEICSHCHPFYTGKEQLIDTAGRVERFKMRRAKAQPANEAKKRIKKAAKKK